MFEFCRRIAFVTRSILGPGGEEVTTTSASTTTAPDSTPGLG